MRKANSNSRLKPLPAEMQATIFSWCSQDGLEATAKRCAAELINPKTGGPLLTNRDSLGKFCEWYPDALKFRIAQNAALDAEELMAKIDPAASAEKLRAFGQLVFMKKALTTETTEDFVGLVLADVKNRELAAKIEGFKVKTAQKQQELDLANKKYMRDTCRLYIEWQENETARKIVAGPGTNSQKIEALGQAMFGEDWE